jgi:hypothetical protein
MEMGAFYAMQASTTIARAGIKMELYHQIMQKWQNNFSYADTKYSFCCYYRRE